jgi:hypothetical protein
MNPTKSTLLRLARPWPWACAAVAAFAAYFIWLVGHRGVFLLDQSIMFDGAWRIYQGQVPYRDFFSAFPPIPYLIQYLIFRVTGVDFSGMVLGAAILNALASLCVIWLVHRFVPDQRVIALVAGLITAVWFQAQFGTLWFEQTSFFFNLVVLVLLVKCLDATHSAATGYRVAAGVLLCVSMLCKQNAGADFVPLALGISAAPLFANKTKALRGVLEVIGGFALAAGLFAMWLWIFSSPATFWKFYFVMAKQIGSDRVGLAGLLLALSPLSLTWHYMIVALGIFATSFTKSRTADMPRATRAIIIWIVIGCAFYQNLFKLHTDNELENSVPFLGLIYGLSFALFWKYAVASETPRTERAKWAVFTCIGIFVLGYPLYSGLTNAWGRGVQEFEVDTVFRERLQVPRMSRVVWGEPTHYGVNTLIDLKDFEALNAWLAETQSNFFVFPDSTMLYGLQGRVSPQPYLYFSPGHSYALEELPAVDAVVANSLKRNNVRVMVLEKDSWVLSHNLWKHMPMLRTWIEGEFEKVRDFGIYEVWVHRD